MNRVLLRLAPTALAGALGAVCLVLAPAGEPPGMTLAAADVTSSQSRTALAHTALSDSAVSDNAVPDSAVPSDAAPSGTAPSSTAVPGTAPASTAAPAPIDPAVPVRSGNIEDQTTAQAVPRPVTMKIEAIDLAAVVRPVGVDENQLLEVPSATQVGWYRHGATPRTEGATVLAAHVDLAGAPAAFFALNQLVPGDVVDVGLSDGSMQRYEVTGVVLHDKAALPADDLFRTDGEPELHLITCGGTFDTVARSYRGNVVVTAVPVATTPGS